MPVKIEWTEGLSVHNEKIDTQHQTYFALLNDIDAAENNGAGKERILRLFDEFVLFVRFHFKTEENVMLEADYSGYREHRMAHSYCLENIKTKLFDYENDATTINEIIDFAVEWFLMHVSAQDKELGTFLVSQRIEVV